MTKATKVKIAADNVVVAAANFLFAYNQKFRDRHCQRLAADIQVRIDEMQAALDEHDRLVR